MTGDGLRRVGTAGFWNNLTIRAVGFNGRTRATGGDFFWVSVENKADNEVSAYCRVMRQGTDTARGVSGLEGLVVRTSWCTGLFRPWVCNTG
jgi:hypothetical protein